MALISGSLAFAQAPLLLPFQGRLTDSSGTPVADGMKVIRFDIYDNLTNGVAVWSGEIHTNSVNGGLVNVLLGTQSSLDGVDFDQQLYLQITVDANDDGATTNDPPLLPRQVILPTIFSANAGLLDGFDSTNFADTVHAHDGADIVSGTVLETVIDGAVARDSEIIPTVLANDGSGSTLDADLFDGLDSTAFAQTNFVDANFVRKSGDTMTGSLVITGGGLDAASITLNGDTRTNWPSDPVTLFSYAENGAFSPPPQATGSNSIALGENNIASGNWSTIGGGVRNEAIGLESVIGGGVNNTNFGSWSTIGEGAGNVVTSDLATIAGGQNNRAGFQATVGGGQGNQAINVNATVGGGFFNEASGDASTIAGGINNRALGSKSTIGGGWLNTASNILSTVSGGRRNTASGDFSTVPGGLLNVAGGEYSFAAGGQSNAAGGAYSFAAGYRAKATNDGAFVWADPIGVDFGSTASNQFLIRAGGGVGIGTAHPEAQLHVAGDVQIVDGSEGADKVLTSDANGLARWESVSNLTEIALKVDRAGDTMTGPLTNQSSVTADRFVNSNNSNFSIRGWESESLTTDGCGWEKESSGIGELKTEILWITASGVQADLARARMRSGKGGISPALETRS